MDDTTRNEIAECLERLAGQAAWDSELWQRCYDLVTANRDNQLLAYVQDDLVHYSGTFHEHNLLGFRVKPDRYELEQYQQEFRDIATALRLLMSLADAEKKYAL